MRISMEANVESCMDCPLRCVDTGHGAEPDSCKHPDAPQSYDGLIPDTRSIPKWCPGLQQLKKEQSLRPAVLIVVEGGSARYYTNRPYDVDIEVWDHDNIDRGDEPPVFKPGSELYELARDQELIP